MSSFLFPLILILFASFFQGSFGIGMKYIKPLAWEAWWLIYTVIAMLLLPCIWAYIVVPHLMDSIFSAPGDALFKGALFGFLWGIGGIMFGISVNYVGVSITYGIVMGLASSMGSLIPLLQMNNVSANAATPYVITGIVLLLAGVVISAVAGIQRDKILSQNNMQTAGDIKQGSAFKKGLVIAIVSGILSALLNVGFADAAPVAVAAEKHGALTRNASLASWVVVLAGAFVMNIFYSLFLLIKNNSWGSFKNPQSGKAYRWAVITGIFWFAALGVYGQGAALMGSLGPVVGWPILLGLALIISNIWAYRSGEWRGAARPFRLMLSGVFVLIVACVILGYSNQLS